MLKVHRDILREKTAELSDDLEPLPLLKHMTKVLKVEDEAEIKAPATRVGKVEKLLEILPRKGGEAFGCFLEALEKEQRHLADSLRREEVSWERCNSANLKSKLSETELELQTEKDKNLKLQGENETLKNLKTQVGFEKLHEQIRQTEVNLKQHFDEVLEKKAKDIALHVQLEQAAYPSSRRSSLNGDFPYSSHILQVDEQRYCTKEDENGNTRFLHDLEKLNMELERCRKRETELESECNELRDRLKSLQSQTSSQEDRSTSPIQQAASEDPKTCKKCDTLGQQYLDLQKTSTEEIQRLMNATVQYKVRVKYRERRH